jgi:hypothetical protein
MKATPMKGQPITAKQGKSLSAEELKRLYADPDDIIPEHTLDDLVQGMRRVLGIQEA